MPESRPLGEHNTRFTAAIVRALESDDADSNKDGVVTAEELFNYLSPPDEARRSKFRTRHWSFSSSPSALSLRRPTGRASEDLVLSVEQSAFVGAFVKELGQRKVIPFLGDGIYGTGPLSFFQIARTLAQEAGLNGGRHQDMIATAAESLELHMQDRYEFLGRLAEVFESQAAECSPPVVHDLVASMPAPWLVVSVNYDSLLERRLDHLQRPYVILSHVLRSGCSDEPETKDREAGKILVLRSNHHPLVKEDPAKAVQLCAAQDVVLQPDDCVIYKLLGSPCWQGRPQVSAQRLDTVVITESDHIDFLVHLRNETTGMPSAISQKLRIGKLAFFEYNLDVWHYRLIGHLFRTGGTGHLLPGSVVLRKTPYMLRTPTSPTEELFWRRRFNPDRVPADLTTFVRAVDARMSEP